ncbi:amino acid adenylation domain-containing protein [Actinomycetota bacterium Odt1-20B]
MTDIDASVRPAPPHTPLRGYPRDHGLADLFEARATTQPQAPAALHHGRTLTYGQLNDLAGRLSERLRAQGLAPGSLVGVCGNRSLEALVALVGILKAGCAYVPLDEDLPPDRLRAMAEDTELRAAVVLPGSAGRVRGLRVRIELAAVAGATPDGRDGAAHANAPTVAAAMSEVANTRSAATGSARPSPSPTDCAYVVFTSGSSGRPKPVAIPHRGVVRLVMSDRQFPPPGPDDRILHAYGLSSDASTIEIWSALLTGACLILADREELLSPTALAELLRNQQVTVAYLTTSVFHLLARTTPQALSELRFVSAGGEAMDPDLARAVLAACPTTTVVNFYGPTENSVVSTAYAVRDLPADATAVPIGRPYGASTCHVLRPDNSPANPGERGELYVGGDGLALGYLGDQGLTSERFVHLPAVEPHGLLYRTGDRVVCGAEGLLEFHGRLDRQVKLRGVRIELDEVEARLRTHPAVGEAVVEAGSGRLTAYVTPAEAGHELHLDALRAYCAQWLPAQAVPTLTAMDSFPVTSGGKVDRRRLPTGGRSAAAALTAKDAAPSVASHVAGLRTALAEIWHQVLRVRPLPDDDFFLLGGDSLLASETVTRTVAVVGLDPSLGSSLIRALLATPTLEGFATAVRELRSTSAGAAPCETVVDWERESELGFDLPAVQGPPPCSQDPSQVLLTGASGFVGAFLLDRLLRTTSARIHCPVRATGRAHAEQRVRAALSRYGLRPEPTAWQRVECFPGDLTEPGLGLPAEHAAELAARLDLVLHNGAHVNFLYPYQSLRRANVDGTREVVRIAAPRRVPVHFISTIAVVAGFGTAGVREVAEDLPLAHADRLTMGYAESKWVAERLLHRAADQGLPISIHRPYEVTGDLEHGICNTETAICSLFKTIAETGVAPEMALPMDFVPVDHLAAAVVHIATHEDAKAQVYHVTNPRPATLSDVLDRMRAAGLELRTLPYGEWVGELVRHVSANPTSPTAPFVSLCVDRGNKTDISVKEMYVAGTFPELGRDNAERALEGSGLDCPPVDAELLDCYLEYFFTSGYIARPASAAEVGTEGVRR